MRVLGMAKNVSGVLQRRDIGSSSSNCSSTRIGYYREQTQNSTNSGEKLSVV